MASGLSFISMLFQKRQGLFVMWERSTQLPGAQNAAWLWLGHQVLWPCLWGGGSLDSLVGWLAGAGSSHFLAPHSPTVLTSPNYAGSPEEQDGPSPGGETLGGAVRPSPRLRKTSSHCFMLWFSNIACALKSSQCLLKMQLPGPFLGLTVAIAGSRGQGTCY